MKPTLSERQEELLRAIIKEFMDTAEAVGSIHLPMKYELGVSPATVRNEMVELVRKGFLSKPHASSGRVPTSIAFKYFIDRLIDSMEMLSQEDIDYINQKLRNRRANLDKLLFETARTLSELTNNTGITLYDDRIYYSGISEMMELPEYQQPRRLRQVMRLLEDIEELKRIFSNKDIEEAKVGVLIGDEDMKNKALNSESIVFAKIRLPGDQQGFIGVIGPYRMDYRVVIPTVSWMAKSISQNN